MRVLGGIDSTPERPLSSHPTVYGTVTVEEIHVNVHYLADTILGLYGKETRVDGAKIHFTREERLPRTAGGVKRLATAGAFDETFVVIMGDALTDVDVRELVIFHKEDGRISSSWTVSDALGLMQQLGLTPQPEDSSGGSASCMRPFQDPATLCDATRCCDGSQLTETAKTQESPAGAECYAGSCIEGSEKVPAC